MISVVRRWRTRVDLASMADWSSPASRAIRSPGAEYATGQVLPRHDVPRAIRGAACRGCDEERCPSKPTLDAILYSRRSEELRRGTLPIEAQVPRLVDHQLHSKGQDIGDAERNRVVSSGAVLDEIREADPAGEKLFRPIGVQFRWRQADFE